MNKPSRLLPLLLLLAAGCPQPQDGGSEPASEAARLSCFDHYPFPGERAERDGYLIELTRVRLLSAEAYPREPLARGTLTKPLPYYFAVDFIVHQAPPEVTLEFAHMCEVTLGGKPLATEGYSAKDSASRADQVLRYLVAADPDVQHGGNPLKVVLNAEAKAGEDAEPQPLSFSFEFSVPEEAWFWAE